MRIKLVIDSATADEAHDFVCAFQRTAGLRMIDEGDPTVTIGGSWSFGIATPNITPRRAEALMAEFAALQLQRQQMPKLTKTLSTAPPALFDESWPSPVKP